MIDSPRFIFEDKRSGAKHEVEEKRKLGLSSQDMKLMRLFELTSKSRRIRRTLHSKGQPLYALLSQVRKQPGSAGHSLIVLIFLIYAKARASRSNCDR